ncbi:MAG: ParB/RepB/Spo0J family partition protein [Gammaproteobacteria bacterium]|nr:ParB/RepB/Spo0J family partition protein [Gammaproteobacteria bacterium]
MIQKKRGLGFNPLLGLDKSTVDAVFKTDQSETRITTAGFREVPTETITPSPYQPRMVFSDVELDELTQSIREHGVMQPLLVRPSTTGFELIAGERRWRAAINANIQMIPVIVRELDDRTAAGLALVENVQREDLSAIEQARALAKMRDEFGMDQARLAQMTSMSRSNIANLLRLLNLADTVQLALDNGELDMGHARALLPLPEMQQVKAAQEVIDKTLSVRQTEALVKRLLAGPMAPRDNPVDPDVERLETKLSDRLGASVKIKPKSGGKGQIVIAYDSLEILDGIIAKLKNKG